jgi:hypothetical protein
MTAMSDFQLSNIELFPQQRFTLRKKYLSPNHSLPTRCCDATDVANSQQEFRKAATAQSLQPLQNRVRRA